MVTQAVWKHWIWDSVDWKVINLLSSPKQQNKIIFFCWTAQKLDNGMIRHFFKLWLHLVFCLQINGNLTFKCGIDLTSFTNFQIFLWGNTHSAEEYHTGSNNLQPTWDLMCYRLGGEHLDVQTGTATLMSYCFSVGLITLLLISDLETGNSHSLFPYNP